MKKIFVLFVLAISFSAAHAFIGNDKVINKNQLPAQAQSFLNENFANVKISYAKLETDFLVSSYEVMLADGTKLEFSNKGNWEEVDCRYGEVPAAIIPVPLKNYLKANYPNEKVLKIERDRRGYDLKLSNKLELKFNNDFEIVDIDD
jgi:hypothetical protein